jgi:hypothetical protein
LEVSTFAEIEGDFVERVHKIVWRNAAATDTKNRLRSRILHPIWEGPAGWFFSRRNSLKAKHIARNPYVSQASIAEVAKPVYVDCEVAWIEPSADKRRIWDLFLCRRRSGTTSERSSKALTTPSAAC